MRHLLTRTARRGDTQRVGLVRDALRLPGVLVAYPVSRRPVRPLTDEVMRSLPVDGLVAGAKIRWDPDRALVLGGDGGQMSGGFVPGRVGETSTRVITRPRGTAERPALWLMPKLLWHPRGFGMPRQQLTGLNGLVETA